MTLKTYSSKPKANKEDKALAARLKTIRSRQNITQQDLAEAIGVTHQQVQKYERGENRITAPRLKAIADYIGIPIHYFWEETTHEAETILATWNTLPQGQIREQLIALIQAVGKLA